MQAESTETTLPEVDFLLEDHGSIILLRPVTSGAREWVDAYIGAGNGYQPYFPDAIIIEPRYLEDVVLGIQKDCLQVLAT